VRARVSVWFGGGGGCTGRLMVTENTQWFSFIIIKVLYYDTVSLVVVTIVSEEPAASILSDEMTSTMKVVTFSSLGDSGDCVRML
jgi:hypothetical protein